MGGTGFLSIFLLTFTISLKQLKEDSVFRESEFLLLAPHCNNRCASAEKQRDFLVVKSSGFEQTKISQPGVFQKHSFLTWIMASCCSLILT